MLKLIYQLLWIVATPLALLILHWPRAGKPSVGRRWPEHLGWVPVIEQPVIWLHAVSVGEVLAIAPLVRALLSRWPDKQLLVTTTTRTGADRVAQLFGERVCHRYAPFDSWPAVWLFLRRVPVEQAILMEMEIWPNWLSQLAKRQIPVSLINARLSARSCARYARLGGLISTTLQRFSCIHAQTQADAERLCQLGAVPARVKVTGNLKFDLEIPTELHSQALQLRSGWGARPVWLAASTHAGEDELLLELHQQLLAHYPELLLVLVPRHPQRFERVAELVNKQGLTLARRARQQAVSAQTQVYLADTMGEMLLLFGCCDLVFMGGSLVPVGGHNVLEPAALAKPVVMGPHWFNFVEATEQLVAEGGCVLVEDMAAAALQLRRWLDQPAEACAAGEAAQRVVARNRGTLARTLEALDSLR